MHALFNQMLTHCCRLEQAAAIQGSNTMPKQASLIPPQLGTHSQHSRAVPAFACCEHTARWPRPGRLTEPASPMYHRMAVVRLSKSNAMDLPLAEKVAVSNSRLPHIALQIIRQRPLLPCTQHHTYFQLFCSQIHSSPRALLPHRRPKAKRRAPLLQHQPLPNSS